VLRVKDGRFCHCLIPCAFRSSPGQAFDVFGQASRPHRSTAKLCHLLFDMLVMALGKFFSNWVKGIDINCICCFIGALLNSGNSVTINPLL